MSSSSLPLDLPDVDVPQIFKIQGGTRMFLVRGGPGKRSDVERTVGENRLSHGPDTEKSLRTVDTHLEVAQQMERLTNVVSKFSGADIRYYPHVYHDHGPKSVYAYEIFKERTPMAFRDAMDDPKTNDFWKHGLNRSNPDLLKTVIVFASTKTIYQVLRQAQMLGRITCAAGGIIPIMFPTHGQPSICVGMGPWAHGALRWGLVTNQEYEAGQTNKKAKKEKEEGSSGEGGGGLK